MNALLTVMLASALAAPAPAGNPGAWVTDADYPKEAFRRGQAGDLFFWLLISPDGRVSRCAVIESSGADDLDQQTCFVMMDRARFDAAHDEAGKPTFGTYTGRMTWTLPRAIAPARRKSSISDRPADMELEVRKLPGGELEKMVTIVTRVDATGHIVACGLANNAPDDTTLGNVACAQAKAATLDITRDNGGNPISVIRQLRVKFKAPAA